MADAGELLAGGRLHRAVMDRLIKGDDREALLSELRGRLDEQQARELVDGAELEIESLRASGRYAREERRVYFRKRPPKSAVLHVIALLLITFGVLGSLGSTLAGGSLFVGIIPLLLGATIMFLNRS